MADIYPNDIPPELDDVSKELPPDLNMDEFIANLTKLAQQFMQKQSEKSFSTQLMIFFGFLLIPVIFILFCFCKILHNHRKRQGKDKKKQKEQKKDTKKETKKETKKKA